MSWPWLVLLVLAAALVVAVELPRLGSRFADARRDRDRQRRKARLSVVPAEDEESDEFIRSVQRDLDSLPTIEERDRRTQVLPEGDSIHRAAARLRPLVGERVEAESPNPRGLATGVARVVDGRVLESVDAVGKHLLLRFDGGVVLRSHLRMTGRWRIAPRGTTRGRPWLVLRGREWEATQWNGPVLTLEQRPVARLGPDLLADETDVSQVVARIRRADESRLVGEALLDQRLVAGIGNMWLTEMLWAVSVSPWRRLGQATNDELTAALAWAREHMRASVAGARPQHAVYRRAGRACPRCGTPIASRGLGDQNRTAYWCPACQPSPTGR